MLDSQSFFEKTRGFDIGEERREEGEGKDTGVASTIGASARDFLALATVGRWG